MVFKYSVFVLLMKKLNMFTFLYITFWILLDRKVITLQESDKHSQILCFVYEVNVLAYVSDEQ